jgi:hypothetical protein
MTKSNRCAESPTGRGDAGPCSESLLSAGWATVKITWLLRPSVPIMRVPANRLDSKMP